MRSDLTHLNEGGTGEFEVTSVRLCRTSSREKRLSSSYNHKISFTKREGRRLRTWRTVHEGTFRCSDTQCLELFGLLHRENDRFDEFFNLLVETSDVGIRLCRLLVNLHGLDSGVVLGGEGVEDEVRVLVDADQISRFERFGGDESDEGEEDGLTGGGLDDGAFAGTLRVEVDVGSVGFVYIGVDVENLQSERVSDGTSRCG